jgi:HK97 family phage major capsid protein
MTVKGLEEKKNDLISQMSEIVKTSKLEARAMSDKEVAEFDKLEKEVQKINATIEREEKENMEMKEIKKEERELTIEERDVKEFDAYLRNRANNLVAGDNGATIPTSIANKIVKQVYDICPILERSTKYNVKGKIQIPYYNEEATAITVAFATEFTELESNAGKFENIELSGYLAGALSLVSNSLINNSQFDIVNFVVGQMAESIARFIEDTLLNGKGEVEGLTGVKNIVTAGSATAITADEVVKLKDAIKDKYQANAIFVMHPETRTALRLLKDGNERYLLQDDITSPFGSTLLGKPVYVTDNAPKMATGKNAIYYGDMKCLATKLSEDANIQVLRERFATQHATGVVGWVEFDSKIEDAQGIATIKMA